MNASHFIQGADEHMKKNRFGRSAEALKVGMFVLVAAAAGFAVPAYCAGESPKESLEQKKDYDTIQQNRSSADAEYMRLTDEHVQLKKEFQKLSGDCQAVTADRDNLLLQTKKLIAARNRGEEMLAMMGQIQGEVEKSAREKEALAATIKTLQDRAASAEAALKDADAGRERWEAEKTQLSASLASLKDQLSSGAAQKELAELKKANAALAVELKESGAENRKLKGSLEQAAQDEQQLREKYAGLQKQHEESAKRVRGFEQKLSESPAKLVELANQNKALIAQTATMHYNLGVFYTRQREFSRAAVEFEKALELKSDDAQSHFNLGYIYAEHIVDRTKAVRHFQEYLKYSKRDDKDVDWVKRYLLTWQAWEGKEPMK